MVALWDIIPFGPWPWWAGKPVLLVTIAVARHARPHGGARVEGPALHVEKSFMATPSKDTLHGLVVRTTGGWYDVRMDGPEARLYRCRVKGTFRLRGIRSTNHVAVRDRVTLLSGHSGVGKSTLLNRLVPEAGARTAALSDAHDAGQHTTTYSEMHDLPSGGALIDTPGIKGFGTFDMERAEVSHYFREIFAESEHCRFRGCTHTHEPGCAVLQAVGERRIAQSRYQSYLSMLDDRDENRYREGY